jgi:hypothetical protein
VSRCASRGCRVHDHPAVEPALGRRVGSDDCDASAWARGEDLALPVPLDGCGDDNEIRPVRRGSVSATMHCRVLPSPMSSARIERRHPGRKATPSTRSKLRISSLDVIAPALSARHRHPVLRRCCDALLPVAVATFKSRECGVGRRALRRHTQSRCLPTTPGVPWGSLSGGSLREIGQEVGKHLLLIHHATRGEHRVLELGVPTGRCG